MIHLRDGRKIDKKEAGEVHHTVLMKMQFTTHPLCILNLVWDLGLRYVSYEAKMFSVFLTIQGKVGIQKALRLYIKL